MRIRISFPHGTLKIKDYRALRYRERERMVPVWRWGSVYFVWYSKRSPEQPELE